nr:CASP-like protein 3A1 [Ipomoea trifida]
MLMGAKTETAIEMNTEGKDPPETKAAAAATAETDGGMTGPLVSERGAIRRKADIMDVILRALCVLTSVTALSLMVTAKQASTITVYGFNIPLRSKWSFSYAFEYLVGVSAAVAVHAMLQLLITGSRLLRRSPPAPSRNHAWLVCVADQVFTYAMMSAASAAAGVSNLNHTGIRHLALPSLCKPLRGFCDRVAASIAFAFLSCFLLAVSVVADVVWLSKS